MLRYAEYERDKVRKALEDAAAKVTDAVASGEAGGVSYVHLETLVKAQAAVHLWARIGRVQETRGGDLLAAVEVIVRESAQRLMRNQTMGRSTNPMSNTCEMLEAEVVSRFVDTYGSRVTMPLKLWSF